MHLKLKQFFFCLLFRTQNPTHNCVQIVCLRKYIFACCVAANFGIRQIACGAQMNFQPQWASSMHIQDHQIYTYAIPPTFHPSAPFDFILFFFYLVVPGDVVGYIYICWFYVSESLHCPPYGRFSFHPLIDNKNQLNQHCTTLYYLGNTFFYFYFVKKVTSQMLYIAWFFYFE